MRDVLARGEQPSSGLARKHGIADKLVLQKVQERFGGRVRSLDHQLLAPLNADVSRWFGSVGLLVQEGYGLTETSSGTTVNDGPEHGAYQYGSVGWPMPGTEVRIAEEDDEILVRGPGVMRGYHNNPEATAEVLDEDGWFHTGDIGRIDERGYLFVTDRKKDLFSNTSRWQVHRAGRDRGPLQGTVPVRQPVPRARRGAQLRDGARHPRPTCAITAWAATVGLAGKSYSEIVTSAEARALVQGYVDRLNDGLNRWETIKKFTILDKDLTIEDGDLTPSMKLRRRAVTEKHLPEIDAMYSEG